MKTKVKVVVVVAVAARSHCCLLDLKFTFVSRHFPLFFRRALSCTLRVVRVFFALYFPFVPYFLFHFSRARARGEGARQ